MFSAEREVKSVVVTGPTGAIGHALCTLLLKEGRRVYAVVRPNSNRISTLPDGVDIIGCDISGYKGLGDRIGHADAFVHLAWANTFGGGRNDMPSQIANIQYSIDAVNAAAELGCKVFVGAGSQAEYGRVNEALTAETPCFPENGYGMAKLCAGEMTRVECQKYGMDHIWFRILSVYGPLDNPNSLISYVIRSFLNGEKPSLTKCEQMWDYIYSEDTARAFLLALEHGSNGAVYPLGSGECRPLSEYVECIRNMINPQLAIGFGDKPYPDKQVMYLKADINELNDDTGWKPQLPFESGIRDIVEHMKNNEYIFNSICVWVGGGKTL